MRFITFEKELHVIDCMSESEFRNYVEQGGNDADWFEYVWQYAPNKEIAIARHDQKMDDWHENPNKGTY